MKHKKHNIFEYLFHVQYIMPYILIQVDESIAKLVTLMVEINFNKLWNVSAKQGTTC
jgi:hypothetical protein